MSRRLFLAALAAFMALSASLPARANGVMTWPGVDAPALSRPSLGNMMRGVLGGWAARKSFGSALGRVVVGGTVIGGGVALERAEQRRLNNEALSIVGQATRAAGQPNWQMEVDFVQGFLKAHRFLGKKALIAALAYTVNQDSRLETPCVDVMSIAGITFADLKPKLDAYNANPAFADQDVGLDPGTSGLSRVADATLEEVTILERRAWLDAKVKAILKANGRAIPKSPTKKNSIEVHHVIPYTDPYARDARMVLQKWWLSIHDPANGVILPWVCHRGPYGHGQPNKGYERDVTNQMKYADRQAMAIAQSSGDTEQGRLVILDRLRAIGDFLDNACGDATTRPLQATLRTVERVYTRPRVPTYDSPSGAYP